MQVPLAASSAASTIAQGAVRERSSGNAEGPSASPMGIEQVHKSEGANPDRDAQGGGDAPLEHPTEATATPAPRDNATTDPFANLPVRAAEPPGELDLLG
jgi:hypothetical protein